MKCFLESSASAPALAAIAIFFAAMFGAISSARRDALVDSQHRSQDRARRRLLSHDVVAERLSRVSPASAGNPSSLAELIKAQPRNAELYSLRAMEDEQQLDFIAANPIGKPTSTTPPIRSALSSRWPISITAACVRG